MLSYGGAAESLASPPRDGLALRYSRAGFPRPRIDSSEGAGLRLASRVVSGYERPSGGGSRRRPIAGTVKNDGSQSISGKDPPRTPVERDFARARPACRACPCRRRPGGRGSCVREVRRPTSGCFDALRVDSSPPGSRSRRRRTCVCACGGGRLWECECGSRHGPQGPPGEGPVGSAAWLGAGGHRPVPRPCPRRAGPRPVARGHLGAHALARAAALGAARSSCSRPQSSPKLFEAD